VGLSFLLTTGERDAQFEVANVGFRPFGSEIEGIRMHSSACNSASLVHRYCQAREGSP